MEIYPKKIVKENFSNLGKEIDMQVQETQRAPIMMDAKKPTQDTSLLTGQRLKVKRDS